MKVVTLFSAGLLAIALPFGAHAAMPKAGTLAAPANVTHQAGLSWRCGKNNPAMWGTFGNGCLKQKRAYKAQQKNSGSQKPASVKAIKLR
jgi:hypothetical protein